MNEKYKVSIPNFKGGIKQFKLMFDKIVEVGLTEHGNKNFKIKGRFFLEEI